MSPERDKTMAKPKNEVFQHGTTLDFHGDTLYDAPIVIRNQEDLDNYHITWNDCITIRIGGCDPRIVYILRTPNRELAEYLWCDLNNERNRDILSRRCMIPGKQKYKRRCPTTYCCSKCPFRELRQRIITISWEHLLEESYEKEWNDDNADSPCEQIGDFHLLLDELQEELDALDVRLMAVLKLRKLWGYSAEKIAAELKCSVPRVYQLYKTAIQEARKCQGDGSV